MTELQAIRWFAETITKEKVIIARERFQWAIDLSCASPRLILPYNLHDNDEGDKEFRWDFIDRCPLARGFANVTLSLLHELGHHYNRLIWLEQDLEEYENATSFAHFALPCEQVATDWAIAWLQNANNRKLAKQFERYFFRR